MRTVPRPAAVFVERERAAAGLVRVYVWDGVVRSTHWLTFLSMLVLTATGLYIGRPFLIVTGPARDHFVMGWVKAIHVGAAYVFAVSALARVAWMFLGPRHAGWRYFLPLGKAGRREISDRLRFYLFMRPRRPLHVTHNALQGLAYAGAMLIILFMVASGLALRAAEAGAGSPVRHLLFLRGLFGGLPDARWWHHAGMWGLWVFLMVHLFVGHDEARVEKNGVFESIFSGYKWVPPEDKWEAEN